MTVPSEPPERGLLEWWLCHMLPVIGGSCVARLLPYSSANTGADSIPRHLRYSLRENLSLRVLRR